MPFFNPPFLFQGTSSPVFAIDGVVTAALGSGQGSSQSFGPLVTVHANDLIVVAVCINQRGGSGINTITGVTSSPSNLPFTLRSAIANPQNSGKWYYMEVWTAPASSALAGEGIVVAENDNTGQSYGMIAFGVSGLANINSPFDGGNAPIKNSTGSTGNPLISGLNTTNTGTDVLLFIEGDCQDGTLPSVAPGGFTLIGATRNNVGQPGNNLYAYYQTISGAQSGVSITDNASWPASWMAVGDALIIAP